MIDWGAPAEPCPAAPSPFHTARPYFVDCHGLPPDFVRVLRSELRCYYPGVTADELDYAVIRIAASIDISRYSSPGHRPSKRARAVRPTRIPCPFTDGQPLTGIIAYLTRTFGGNVHEKGVVDVTSSAAQSGSQAKNLANLDSTSCFITSDQAPGQWVAYDFKTRRVIVTHYTLRSQPQGQPGYCNPKDWVVDGSNDGSTWIELDKRADDSHLNGRDMKPTFAVARRVAVQRVRFTQTGQSHAHNGFLNFCAWELFGTIVERTH
jgi:hypothetical protein